MGIAQRSTTRREREHRVWDRRMAVYDESLILIHRIAHDRGEMVRTGILPERRNPQTDRADITPVLAKLEIYGSDQLLAAHEKTFEAMREWINAWGIWKTQEETNPRRSDRDPLWVIVTEGVRKAEEADRRFVELLRAEARADGHGKRKGVRFRNRTGGPTRDAQ
ncbi:hypothetical protein G3I60_18980 [Streptomyces sp. SID13666]|uniref:hypothetical protein n=1 Tax=Streptomyces sp. SID13588 TaxID=2706051 RepID=UPI0013BFC4E0|nr:hypothetical protein [Streptomyces sp. SID13588]NEA56176.1 hypothetical protein [Streptomyces sp. SID13666]NEA71847.1 hypothetical protein [Streptomyces sp. SID13588]